MSRNTQDSGAMRTRVEDPSPGLEDQGVASGTHLWVLLVLHALHQHALDHLHVMLLLVAKDPREVPAIDQTIKTHLSSLAQLWGERGRVHQGSHQKMCRAASRKPTSVELTESNRNLSSSGHWLFPSSSREPKREPLKKEQKHARLAMRACQVFPRLVPPTNQVAAELGGDVAHLLADVGRGFRLDAGQQLCLDGRLHVLRQAGVHFLKGGRQQPPQQNGGHLLDLDQEEGGGGGFRQRGFQRGDRLEFSRGPLMFTKG